MCVCTRCRTCSVYNNIIIVFFALQYANWLHVVFYASVERDNSYTARSYHRLLQFRPFIPTTEKLFSPLRISFPRNTAGTASLCAIYPLKTRSSIQSPRVSSAIDAWWVARRELWRTQCALTKKNIPPPVVKWICHTAVFRRVKRALGDARSGKTERFRCITPIRKWKLSINYMGDFW